MKKDLLESLVGKIIKVDRGGPNSRTGKLLSVANDYFTLLTEEDGIVFYTKHHVKSITENTRNKMHFSLRVPEHLTFKPSRYFLDLLKDLKFQWVKINRGGPEKVEGVLHDANEDYVTIVSDEEIIRLATYHIKNISYDSKIDKDKDDKKKDDHKRDRDEHKKDKDDHKKDRDDHKKDDCKDKRKDDHYE